MKNDWLGLMQEWIQMICEINKVEPTGFEPVTSTLPV